MHKLFLGLGTNLGNREENLTKAVRLIAENVGEVLAVSSFYKSEPQGFVSDNDFLNAVVMLHTNLSPFEVLDETRKIEKQLGRKNKTRKTYADRIIDIDILYYDDLIINTPELKIPHPHITKRDFVLVPLAEIAPELEEKFKVKKEKD